MGFAISAPALPASARLDPKQALTGRIGELLHPPRVLAGGFRAGLRGILRTYRLRFQSSGAPGGRTPRVPRGCLTALLTAPHAARPASLQSRPEKADQGRPLPATGVRTHGPRSWHMATRWRFRACTVVNTDDVDDVLGGGPGPTPGRAGIALALATRALFGGLKKPNGKPQRVEPALRACCIRVSLRAAPSRFRVRTGLAV